MAILNITWLLILIGTFVKPSHSANNCSPWPPLSKVQCVGFIPEFSAGNPVENLVLRKCKPDLKLNKSSFNNLNNLNRLEILCEFASNSTGLVFQDKVFTDIESNLEWLYLDNNNIETLPDEMFCNSTKLNWIILSNNRLEDVSKIGFGHTVCAKTDTILENIFLRNNLLTVIKNNTFDRLHRLSQLDLAHNHLQEIQADALVGLVKLYHLDLSYNNLTYISDEMLRQVDQVEELFVSNNKLNSSSISAINRQLTQLIVLNASSNAIDIIDGNSFRNLTELGSLDLSNNPLTIRGSPFQTLALLSYLHLNQVGLKQLNLAIFIGLKSLIRLYLMDNELKHLDRKILHQILNLEELYLSGNRFTTIPDLDFVADVTYLFLDKNMIENISHRSFSAFRMLRTVNLSRNKLKSLRKGTFNSTSLLEIDLSWNMIESLEKDCLVDPNDSLFSRGWYVNSLNLDHNSIREFHSNFSDMRVRNISIAYNRIRVFQFEHMPTRTQVLNASHNEIHTLQKSLTFTYLPDIITIDLSNNKIARVIHQNFPPNFQYIYLHNNLIDYFSPDFMSHRLKLLTLHGNKLKNLCPPNENYYIYNLMQLSVTVSGNPLTCSCELGWLTKLNPSKGDQHLPISISDLDKVECQLPFPKSTNPRKIHVKGNHQYEDFLCTSNNTHPNSCNCLVHKSWCQLPCPGSCTCYHNAAETSIMILDCARQNLTTIPDISGMKQISYYQTMIAYFDGSLIGQIRQHDLDFYLHAKKLFLNNSAISAIDEGAFNELGELLQLHLDNNKLKTLPEMLFSKMSKLRELHLANNQIAKLAPNVFIPLASIQLLTLENNSLINFPVWNLQQSSLEKLTIGGNPWMCGCDYIRKFREWLQQGNNQSSYVQDAEKLTCQAPSADFVPIMSYELQFCQENKFYIWLSILAIFVFLTVVSICLFFYRHELQVLIYAKYGFRLFSVNEVQADQNKTFDIFLSYSSLDDKFVVREFLPHLEKIENPYRVCLHQRDFIIGRHIINNIFDAVENSKRTVVLLSANFVESQWCKFEFKAAHCQMIEDQCNRLIMVVKDVPKSSKLEPEMKLYMRTNTYLKWGDSQFWDKLYFALPDTKFVETNPAFEEEVNCE